MNDLGDPSTAPLDFVLARNTYWGSPSGPPAGSFSGPVDASNPLTVDPCPKARAAGEAFVGEGVAGRSDVSSLGEQIAEARAALQVALAAGSEAAAALVLRLDGLQRRDRADAAGQHAATRTLLEQVRDHLTEPGTPVALRRAAEVALVANLADLVRHDEYEAAEAVAATFATRVVSEDVQREMTLVSAMVDEAAGRYAEAAAKVLSVAGGLQRSASAQAWRLEAVAEAMAAKADEAALPPALSAHVALRSEAGSALLSAPYPNPAGRSADVRLVLSLEAGAEVSVAVYDVLGRQVGTLAEGRLSEGRHELLLPTASLAGGTYLVRAVVEEAAGSRALTQRVTVLR